MGFRDWMKRNLGPVALPVAPFAAPFAVPLAKTALHGAGQAKRVVKDVAREADRGIKRTLDVAELGTELLNRQSGGRLAPLHQAAKGTKELYGTASNVAEKLPVMLSSRKYDDAGAPLEPSRRTFGRETLSRAPLDHQSLVAGLAKEGVRLDDSPNTLALLEALKDQKNPDGDDYWSNEGRASLLQLAKREGGQGLEEATGTLHKHLLSKPGDPGLRELAADGLRDVAFPTTINQGAKANCGGIAVQQFWAHQKPTDYLDCLMTLGQNKPFRLPSGNVLTPLNESLAKPEDDRRPSVKVIGDALSAHAHDHSHLRQSALELGKTHPAIERNLQAIQRYHPTKQPMGIHSPHELAGLMKELTGQNYQWKTNGAINEASDDLARGRIVPTLLAGSAIKEWHWVNIAGETPSVDGNSTLRLSSWGGEYDARRSELEPFMRAVLVVETSLHPGKRQPSWRRRSQSYL